MKIRRFICGPDEFVLKMFCMAFSADFPRLFRMSANPRLCSFSSASLMVAVKEPKVSVISLWLISKRKSMVFTVRKMGLDSSASRDNSMLLALMLPKRTVMNIFDMFIVAAVFTAFRWVAA